MKKIIIWIILLTSSLVGIEVTYANECVCEPIKYIKEVKKENPKVAFCKEQGQTNYFCTSLLESCHTTDDPKNCFWVWLAINFNETSFKSYSFWMKKNDNFKWFAKNYNKYWYSNKWDMWFFYWRNWIVWKSYYCTEEESSWANGRCPNWLKNSTFMLNKYIKEFWD